MNVLVKNIKWIMLISGVLTCTMLQAVFAPEAAVAGLFGEPLQGPLANMIVRSWGVLITLIGLMLIYGAFNPEYRKFAAVIAASSKIAYAVLVISLGSPYLNHAALVIVFDSMVEILLLIYVFTPGNDTQADYQASP
jgi:hypothetical protein